MTSYDGTISGNVARTIKLLTTNEKTGEVDKLNFLLEDLHHVVNENAGKKYTLQQIASSIASINRSEKIDLEIWPVGRSGKKRIYSNLFEAKPELTVKTLAKKSRLTGTPVHGKSQTQIKFSRLSDEIAELEKKAKRLDEMKVVAKELKSIVEKMIELCY